MEHNLETSPAIKDFIEQLHAQDGKAPEGPEKRKSLPETEKKRRSLPQGKNRKKSLPSQNLDKLVLYNDEGKPYIDVNKLIYSPVKRKPGGRHAKESLSFYIPDHAFLLCNMCTLIITSYLLTLGVQLIFWNDGIEAMLSLPKPPAPSLNKTPTAEEGPKYGTILRVGSAPGDGETADVGTEVVGFMLIFLWIFHSVNVFLGLLACFKGYRKLLIAHFILDILLLLLYLISSLVMTFGGRCDPEDMKGFHQGFEQLIRNYVEPRLEGVKRDEQYYAITLLDSIQLSMQCCGASGWSDYINSKVTWLSSIQEGRRFKEVSVARKAFPYSCCRPWWVRNIHCSENAHLWTYPNTSRLELKRFRERINQVGCVPKVWTSCKTLLYQLSFALFLCSIVMMLILIIEGFSVHAQVRNLDMITRELRQEEEKRRKARRQFQIHNISSDSDSEPDEETKRAKGEGKGDEKALSVHAPSSRLRTELEKFKGELPPPKEDEIWHVKTRTPFTQFELRMKDTNIGKLLQVARESVMTTKVNENPAPTTPPLTPPPPPVKQKKISFADEEPSKDEPLAPKEKHVSIDESPQPQHLHRYHYHHYHHKRLEGAHQGEEKGRKKRRGTMVGQALFGSSQEAVQQRHHRHHHRRHHRRHSGQDEGVQASAEEN